MKPKLINELACVGLITATLMCFACIKANKASEVVSPDPQKDISEQLPPGEGLEIGVDAPAFSLPDIDGNFHNLADYIGKEVVLVFYRTGT